MKRILFLLICGSLLSMHLQAQNKLQLIKFLSHEKDPIKHCRLYDTLANCYLMDGKGDDTCYAICEAHLVYDSRFLGKSYRLITLLSNGDKWSYYTGVNSNARLNRAENYYLLLLEEAKEADNKIYECKAYAHLAGLVRFHPGYVSRYTDYAKSADSIATILKSDSLHSTSLLAIAQCNLYNNNLILAFQNISTAADYADNVSDSTFKRQCYTQYAQLYLKLKMTQDALTNISAAFRIDSSKTHYNKISLLEDFGLKAMIHELVPRIGYQLARTDYTTWLEFCHRREIYPAWEQTIRLYIFDSYLKEKRFIDALKYYQLNPNFHNVLKDFKQEYRMAWANSSYNYSKLKYDKAERDIRIVIDTLKKQDDNLLIGAELDLSSILIMQKKYLITMDLLDEIHSETTDMDAYNSLSNDYQKLSALFDSSHDYQHANDARKKGINLRDTVNKLRNEALFNQFRLVSEKIHTENRQQLTDAFRIRNTRLLYLVGFFVILLLLGASAWFAAAKMPAGLIRFAVVVSFVITFELANQILHEPLSSLTDDNPIELFILDVIIGAILGFIHQIIEKQALNKLGVTSKVESNINSSVKS